MESPYLVAEVKFFGRYQGGAIRDGSSWRRAEAGDESRVPVNTIRRFCLTNRLSYLQNIIPS
jgi:hypothetical protein